MPVLTDRQFQQTADLVRSLCGINLHGGKRELVKARLSKRMRALGVRDFDEYLVRVRREGPAGELTLMLDAISTNLTFFFRQAKQFDHLRNLLTKARAEGRGRGRRLRIWSAGCSSGEEPYSVAILVREILSDLPLWDVGILATDLSTRMLAAAREGIYKADRLSEAPPGVVGKYFTCIQVDPERLYQVKPEVRELVSFAHLNLMDPWPMRGPFDMVFCRNVMIYFDRPTQARLVKRFWDILPPGGILYMGHSESLTGIPHRFRHVQPSTYQRL